MTFSHIYNLTVRKKWEKFINSSFFSPKNTFLAIFETLRSILILHKKLLKKNDGSGSFHPTQHEIGLILFVPGGGRVRIDPLVVFFTLILVV
jgi:hypothetical protein